MSSFYSFLSGLRTSSRRWRMRSSSWGSFMPWSTPSSITGRVSYTCLSSFVFAQIWSNSFYWGKQKSAVPVVLSFRMKQVDSVSFLFPHQSCVGIRRYLPKVWPCWETPKTTQHCRGLCHSWQRWRIRWSSCIRSRQLVTSSSSQSCWLTTSASWVLCG